jgi:hypothetical protein
MKYAVKMGSNVDVLVHTKFHKDRFRHSKVDRGNMQISRQHCDFINLVLFC